MKKEENKNNSKKILTICGLSALCLAVLTGAYFLTKEPENDFVPASTETGSSTDTWKETTDTDTILPSGQPSKETQIEGSTSDQTQVVVTEDETGSTSNLSDSVTKEDAATSKPQDKPVTTDDTKNPDKQPEYDPSVPTTKPDDTPPADKGTDTPAPSAPDNDHPGQVYDPVFGWIDTGDTRQDNVDSDGDINKQIGTMGGN